MPDKCLYSFFEILLFSALCQGGCATQRPLSDAPDISAPTLETLEDARELLLQNYGIVDSMKATGELELRRIDEGYRKRASFALLLERPDRLRMRAYRAFAPTVFELVSNGRECWLFVPSEKTAYLNKGCNGFYSGAGHSALSAETIVAALVVVADPEIVLSSPAHAYREGDLMKIVLSDETGTRRELWIDVDTGFVSRQRFMGNDGILKADITYGENIRREGAVIPRAVDIFFPAIHTSLLLHIDDFQNGVTVVRDVFDFAPPEDANIVEREIAPHDMLHREESRSMMRID